MFSKGLEIRSIEGNILNLNFKAIDEFSVPISSLLVIVIFFLLQKNCFKVFSGALLKFKQKTEICIIGCFFWSENMLEIAEKNTVGTKA